jgi:gentisate 1,2-dioxygenase
MSKKHENHREDVAGRANVEDAPELPAYYYDLEKYSAGALWTVANKSEPWEPKSQSIPVVWRYKELREHVMRAIYDFDATGHYARPDVLNSMLIRGQNQQCG